MPYIRKFLTHRDVLTDDADAFVDFINALFILKPKKVVATVVSSDDAFDDIHIRIEAPDLEDVWYVQTVADSLQLLEGSMQILDTYEAEE